MTLLNTFDLTYPIVQAPMAGATTAELAATVSNFGGLGHWEAERRRQRF